MSTSPAEKAQPDSAQFRKTRLKLAVATSLASKVISTLVQVLAYPIAVKALGVERFGVYAVVAASMNWITMANIGIGPGLTLGIASAAAQGDRRKEKEYFSSAFFMVMAIGLVLCIGIGVVAAIVPAQTLFGAQYAPYANDIRQCLLALDVILVGQLIFSITEAAIAGYQEHYIINAWGMAGNLLSIVGLVLTSMYFPTVVGMALSVYGAPVLMRVINGLWLIFVRRRYLLPSFSHCKKEVARNLLHTGLAFALMQLATFINHSLSIVLIGKWVGPKAAASYAVMMQALLLAFGMITMHAQPMWPAIADAMERNEPEWVARLYAKVRKFSMLYALGVGCLFAFGGQLLVKVWMHGQTDLLPTLPLQIATGLYFVLVVWENIHYMVLVGMKQVWKPALQIAVRSLIMLALLPLLTPILGRAAAMVALCIALSVTTGWMLMVSVRSLLRTAQQRNIPSVA